MKIAICVEKNDIWGFIAWIKATSLLVKNGHEIVGIWTFPRKLGSNRKLQVILWYFRTFGPINFLVLGLFVMLLKCRVIIHSIIYRNQKSFRGLARSLRAAYFEEDDPNSHVVISQIGILKPDIIFIMNGFVVKKAFLELASLGVLNKHAAALPANRGLFPYIWSKIHSTPQGISIHLVTDKIDEGPILYQRIITAQDTLRSMTSFYYHVFNSFPNSLLKAIHALENNYYISQSHLSKQSSKFSLPTKFDIKRFRQNGGRLIRFKDFSLLGRKSLWSGDE